MSDMMTLRPFNINDAETILSWCKDKHTSHSCDRDRLSVGVRSRRGKH
ncbi:hypothetical protein [Prevotella sp. P6B1]|nr:hypothetical protein [Prevotella sp. P6B1]